MNTEPVNETAMETPAAAAHGADPAGCPTADARITAETDRLPVPTDSWEAVTPGGTIVGGATAVRFRTGDWRTDRPVWNVSNCRQCLLCVPVCPDSSISVKAGKRQEFNYFHCKGCGICAAVCPFTAITMEKER